ncbi:MAG: ribonuclease III [Acidobacteriota bacterium]
MSDPSSGVDDDVASRPAEREGDREGNERGSGERAPGETDLADRLGHAFADPTLLTLALTHRSHSNERGEAENYERLEFLGDAILGLVTAEWLYDRFRDEPEGELAKLKSYLVSAPVIGEQAKGLGVGPLLRLGVGEARSGGREKMSILADAMEALYGALYLDGGLDAARRVIEPWLAKVYDERDQRLLTDAKTTLQEAAQARGWGLPSYRLVAESGPDHAKQFTFDCWIGGRRVSSGVGRSKKIAEQAAAAEALRALDLLGGGS